MNTIRSLWYGWGVLCVAGGGAYYFAKKSVNADRMARFEADQKKKARLRRLEASSIPFNDTSTTPKAKSKNPSDSTRLDHAGDPSSEISEEAAAVGHAPVNSEQKLRERSKYEAAEPYRSKPGDRLS